jgi:hypothetical protein
MTSAQDLFKDFLVAAGATATSDRKVASFEHSLGDPGHDAELKRALAEASSAHAQVVAVCTALTESLHGPPSGD